MADQHLAYGHLPGAPSQEKTGGGLFGAGLSKWRSKEQASSLFGKASKLAQDLKQEVSSRLEEKKQNLPFVATPSYSQETRFGSFVGAKEGNEAKWYVDGCSYMWAVSVAIEQAKHSIWIMDWWLSPELYLRRPPARNEQYRLDRMLKAAADRGVKVNVMVYKEVAQALTRKFLSPVLPDYLHSLLPPDTDLFTSTIAKLGLATVFASLEHVEAKYPLIDPPVPVSSVHTKHALEALSPNISVFRHPDHAPDAATLSSSLLSSFSNLRLSAAAITKLPGDALQGIYGMNDDIILFWAHHEKLCLIDGRVAFMGGLDLCYGRWDTWQHSISDAHPGDLDEIVFPGQDFNNARIMDFANVDQWEQNKLDRKESSRMGWSDISIALEGPVVDDLHTHFVERWNFIYNEKYDVRKDSRYTRLSAGMSRSETAGSKPGFSPTSPVYKPTAEEERSWSQAAPLGAPARPHGGQSAAQQGFNPQDFAGQTASSPTSRPAYRPDNPQDYASAQIGVAPYAFDGAPEDQPARYESSPSAALASHPHMQRLDAEGEHLREKFEQEKTHLENKMEGKLEDKYDHAYDKFHHTSQDRRGPLHCQIVRSASKWSHGLKAVEHSIQNAYVSVIQNSQRFVYIENQFFITATGTRQGPVKNQIGAAIVDRILRAARAGEKYKMIVVMPAVPAFAGDLKDESSLGTRAIMEYQYNSINRGGHSIMEEIARAGFDPAQYIRFYNLRNYDRINASAAMQEAESTSGVSYEEARRDHDNRVDSVGYQAQAKTKSSPTAIASASTKQGAYEKYQAAADGIAPRAGLGRGRWDSVAECYMLNGPDIASIPWESPVSSDGKSAAISEMDAYVSEELYIHSKVLIADDRTVICGSANLNDRSQLGYHDSEIAVVVEDPTALESHMDGAPWRVSKFAATLRRMLFRKHLGLLPAQEYHRAQANFEPVDIAPNEYDYGSEMDRIVEDPLSDAFHALWNGVARTNSDAFGKCFHPVPHDSVQTWKEYDAFYERYFKEADAEADGKKVKVPAKYRWGHVVREEFSDGEQGVRELKAVLGRVRGSLVEMPLQFLIKEDIAKEGLSLNAWTEDVYT